MSNECETVTIIQGEDRDFFIRVTDICTNDNFDLTGMTAAKAVFKGATANVEITLLAAEIVVIAPATNGKIQLFIDDTKSAQLKPGLYQTFEVELEFTAVKRIIKLEKLLNVEARI